MKVGTYQGVPPQNESHPFLSIDAPMPGTLQTSLVFFYIGKSTQSLNQLSDCFDQGYTAENLASAKKILQSTKFRFQPADVIFLDTVLDGPELTAFSAFLKEKAAWNTIPVIYNEKRLLNRSVAVSLDLIDDIIDLNHIPLNIWSKISFLKKAKEHQVTHTAQPAPAAVRPAGHFWKRAFDILASSLAILALLPLFLLIALAIRLESRGPIFYNAKRAGRGFRIFKFYKFRTMVVNADQKIAALAHLNQYNDASDKGPKFFKISNDPRITRVGKFLRNTSLDELPQLFNVLKGDMSLVGNRPLPLYEAATLTTNEYVERFMAPAGITGLWQIKKRGNSEMSVEERISLDINYARKYNLAYDLWIMANTPMALFQKSNV
ncbi:MAG TPA: sugar transferase [Chitinophagaceae bacterium]|nr:sugar transferase [Chitinophagaceae bacterium]